ncbi:hypothetical protein PG987_012084 [Apiospora arundinis]
MPTYHPLNESKREIRLLSIPRPKAPLHEGDLLQCELVQVSLDDLDDQYVKFLGLASPAIRDFRGLTRRARDAMEVGQVSGTATAG